MIKITLSVTRIDEQTAKTREEQVDDAVRAGLARWRSNNPGEKGEDYLRFMLSGIPVVPSLLYVDTIMAWRDQHAR